MATMFAAIGSAVASASSAASTWFSSATAAASAAGTAGTISNVLSAGSALAAIGQGFAARGAARDQAAFARAEEAQVKAAGAAEARDLAREYESLRSEQQVIQLANGLDIGTGTPADIGAATQRQADRNLDMTRQNASNRASMSRLRSRGLLSEGRSSLMAGFGSAAQTGLSAYQLTG